jgi:hypothetical protein
MTLQGGERDMTWRVMVRSPTGLTGGREVR